jgi:hypothetical protein
MSASCDIQFSEQKSEESHLWKFPPDYNDDGRSDTNADQVILPADIREASWSTLQQG